MACMGRSNISPNMMCSRTHCYGFVRADMHGLLEGKAWDFPDVFSSNFCPWCEAQIYHSTSGLLYPQIHNLLDTTSFSFWTTAFQIMGFSSVPRKLEMLAGPPSEYSLLALNIHLYKINSFYTTVSFDAASQGSSCLQASCMLQVKL